MREAEEDIKSRYPHLFPTMEGSNATIIMGHDSTFEYECSEEEMMFHPTLK